MATNHNINPEDDWTTTREGPDIFTGMELESKIEMLHMLPEMGLGMYQGDRKSKEREQIPSHPGSRHMVELAKGRSLIFRGKGGIRALGRDSEPNLLCKIDGYTARLAIDTGSKVRLLSRSLVHKVAGVELNWKKGEILFQSVTGHGITTYETIKVHFDMGPLQFSHSCYVVNDQITHPFDGLLERDIIKTQQLTINLARRTLTLPKKEEIPFRKNFDTHKSSILKPEEKNRPCKGIQNQAKGYSILNRSTTKVTHNQKKNSNSEQTQDVILSADCNLPLRSEIITMANISGLRQEGKIGVIESYISSQEGVVGTDILAKTMKGGQVPVHITNLSIQPRKIEKGECVGTFLRAVEDKSSIKPCTINKSSTSDLTREQFSQLFNWSHIGKGKKQPLLKNLLYKYRHVFATQDYDLGYCQVVEHEINTGDASLIYQLPYRIPYAQREKINEIIDELLDHRIISHSKSPCDKLNSSDEGIRPDPDKINCVLTFPKPTNKHDIKLFLGLTGYYRRHIKSYADIAKPLKDLLKNDAQFQWGEEQERSFERLKEVITSSPHLKSDFTKPFKLATDASNEAIGAVLSQEDKRGEMPIAYASRILRKSEKNYSTTEKKILAVVWATKYFKPYLYERKFIILIDHRPLKWLMSNKDSSTNSRIARWIIFLQEFEFEVRHKARECHKNADALSRIPIRQIVETEDDLDPIYSKAQIQDLQRRNPKWNPIIQQLEDGTTLDPDLKIQFFLDEEGALYHLQPLNQGDFLEQLVIPSVLIPYLLHTYHDTPVGGYLGARKMQQKLQTLFYWQNMNRDIKTHCQECQRCAIHKRKDKRTEAEIQLFSPLTHLFERTAMDIIGPLPITTNGNKYILVFVDHFSRYAEAIPLPNIHSKTIAKAFVTNIVLRHSTPVQLLTDRAPNLISKMFKEVCELLHIKLLHTTAYHPASRPTRTKYDVEDNFASELHLRMASAHQLAQEYAEAAARERQKIHCQTYKIRTYQKKQLKVHAHRLKHCTARQEFEMSESLDQFPTPTSTQPKVLSRQPSLSADRWDEFILTEIQPQPETDLESKEDDPES
ncbi:uncharacterized protein LOC111615516 [Centruroides sculpturatus]|uniref:uncharacterized protein LOC111615516 n=1 Tax=Centruroides sculpturatus TaxID=218467 RepID=UPI000C6CC422|nr:uncharacterized protein LOC111615516 [Centruroides sculpturatus]